MEEQGALKKRYKIIILVASILLLTAIVVLIIGFFVMPAKYDQYFNEEYKACIAENEQMYYRMLVRKTGDKAYCSKLLPDQAQLCMQQGKLGDTSACEGLPEQENKMCRAQILRDPSLCDENDSWCIATASNDPSFCEQIEEASLKKECIAVSTLNSDFYLSDEIKTECTQKAKTQADMIIRAAEQNP